MLLLFLFGSLSFGPLLPRPSDLDLYTGHLSIHRREPGDNVLYRLDSLALGVAQRTGRQDAKPLERISRPGMCSVVPGASFGWLDDVCLLGHGEGDEAGIRRGNADASQGLHAVVVVIGPVPETSLGREIGPGNAVVHGRL